MPDRGADGHADVVSRGSRDRRASHDGPRPPATDECSRRGRQHPASTAHLSATPTDSGGRRPDEHRRRGDHDAQPLGPRRRGPHRASWSTGRTGRIRRPDTNWPTHGRTNTSRTRDVADQRVVRIELGRDRQPCGSTRRHADHSHPRQNRRTLSPQSRPFTTLAMSPLRLRRVRPERGRLPSQQRGNDQQPELAPSSSSTTAPRPSRPLIVP